MHTDDRVLYMQGKLSNKISQVAIISKHFFFLKL